MSAARSQRFHSSFTGSDTDRFFHLGHKDFAIADFSGLGLFQNRLNCALRAIVSYHDLEFNFGKKIHRILGAPIDLAVSLLPAKSFYLAQSHSFDACRHQCFSHRLGFEWLNDGLDFFHRAKLNPPAFEMASTRDQMAKGNRKPSAAHVLAQVNPEELSEIKAVPTEEVVKVDIPDNVLRCPDCQSAFIQRVPSGHRCGNCGRAITIGTSNGRCGYSQRLPMVVISPYTRSDYVSGNLTDTAEARAPLRYAGMESAIADIGVFFAYPWPEERALMRQLFEAVAREGALLVMYHTDTDIRVFRKVEGKGDLEDSRAHVHRP